LTKNSHIFTKTLVFVIILLFIGIGIKPAFAAVSTESETSELVEITLQFYEKDRTYNHTVMLSKEQAQELDFLKDNFKNQIESIDNPIETEDVYKNAIVSLNELRLLPENMSTDYAQQLVTDKKNSPLIKNAFEKLVNNKRRSNSEYENIFCLIAGDSDKTSFAGPALILLVIHFVLIILRINYILDWVSLTSRIGELLVNIFKEVFREIYQLRLLFWLFLGAGINSLPLKIGAIIGYGFPNFDPFSYDKYPAEGWASTLGVYGKKSWSGSFFGAAFGFTGIKIIRDFFDFFYLGTALGVVIFNEYSLKK